MGSAVVEAAATAMGPVLGWDAAAARDSGLVSAAPREWESGWERVNPRAAGLASPAADLRPAGRARVTWVWVYPPLDPIMAAAAMVLGRRGTLEFQSESVLPDTALMVQTVEVAHSQAVAAARVSDCQ